jgi:hypothetical protein
VSIRGTIYPSQKEAARAFGIGPSAIAQSLRRNGHCDRVGLGNTQTGNTNAIARPIVLFGHRYRSVKSAADALGISRPAIKRFLLDPKRYAATGERIYGALMAADSQSLDRRGKPADNA